MFWFNWLTRIRIVDIVKEFCPLCVPMASFWGLIVVVFTCPSLVSGKRVRAFSHISVLAWARITSITESFDITGTHIATSSSTPVGPFGSLFVLLFLLFLYHRSNFDGWAFRSDAFSPHNFCF
jgi:hypothetical protein